MSGKKLTRKEFEALPKMTRGSDWARRICELTDSAEAMAAHIEAVGVFAPEEPTDEGINATIAKAQGWKGHRAAAGVVTDWVDRNSGGIIGDYSPVSNLGQALEAAAALKHGTYGNHLQNYILYAVQDCAAGLCSQGDSARAISLHLYKRIKEGES